MPASIQYLLHDLLLMSTYVLEKERDLTKMEHASPAIEDEKLVLVVESSSIVILIVSFSKVCLVWISPTTSKADPRAAFQLHLPLVSAYHF